MQPKKAVTVGGEKVRRIAKTFIRPETPTDEHWLALSNLDRVVNPTFSSVISFYPDALANFSSFDQLTLELKSSLAKVLVPFYPLAGRLKLREDGKVDLHCNDTGAIFLEASVEVSLTQIGGPQPLPALSGLNMARVGPGPKYVPDQLTPMPVLIIQVTKFKCGAVALASSWHHTVADGSSGVHFLKSWAEVVAGKEISVRPSHDRALLQPRTPPNPSLVNQYSSGSGKNSTATTMQPSSVEQSAVLRIFHLDREIAYDLKRKTQLESVESDTGGVNPAREFSTVETVSAHLWKSMRRARSSKKPVSKFNTGRGDSKEQESCDTSGKDQQQDVGTNDDTKFFMFVDGRRRLGLPAGFFGNVVCTACALSSEEEILKRPMSYAAGLIREAVRSVTGEYFRSLIDWVEVQGLAPAKSEHVNSVGHDVAATFWTLFPLYDLDFGWGKPSFSTRNSPPRPFIDGIAMMPSPKGAGSMIAVLNLPSDRMSRLQSDPAFSSVFSSQAITSCS